MVHKSGLPRCRLLWTAVLRSVPLCLLLRPILLPRPSFVSSVPQSCTVLPQPRRCMFGSFCIPHMSLRMRTLFLLPLPCIPLHFCIPYRCLGVLRSFRLPLRLSPVPPLPLRLSLVLAARRSCGRSSFLCLSTNMPPCMRRFLRTRTVRPPPPSRNCPLVGMLQVEARYVHFRTCGPWSGASLLLVACGAM